MEGIAFRDPDHVATRSYFFEDQQGVWHAREYGSVTAVRGDAFMHKNMKKFINNEFFFTNKYLSFALLSCLKKEKRGIDWGNICKEYCLGVTRIFPGLNRITHVREWSENERISIRSLWSFLRCVWSIRLRWLSKWKNRWLCEEMQIQTVYSREKCRFLLLLWRLSMPGTFRIHEWQMAASLDYGT